MTDASAFGDRIAAAMGRIEASLANMPAQAGYSEDDLAAARTVAEAASAAKLTAAQTELDRMQEALTAEQKAHTQLRELADSLKEQKEAETAKVAALTQELEHLKAARAADRSELEDLIAALKPLVTEQS